MRFEVILALIQGLPNQDLRDALHSNFSKLSFERGFRYLLRDNHGNLFLWDLELFLPSFKVGQTKVQNMRFCRLSRNWNFKVDLDMHMRDKHGHLFLWEMELFCLSFKVGQMGVENMPFCRLSWNWNFKVDLDTHLRHKMHFCQLSWNLVLNVI